MQEEADRCACGVAMDGRQGHAYNEEAFGYLVAIERLRAWRSGRSFLLVRVDLEEQAGISVRIDPVIASELFAGLWLCLRETDFIGWYREQRMAGAVLTELGDAPRTNVARLIGQRLRRVLGTRLPADVARRLQVSVYEQPEAERIESFSPTATCRPGAELISGEI